MAKPLVALVGRPNVGKSTLFNRIVGERVAIVEDVAGTTRDRLYGNADWNGRDFTLIDTGGLEITPGSDLARRVREQAEVAIQEADVIVFLVDAREGATSEDVAIAELLRQARKPVLVAANKADNEARRLDAVDFYQLGLPELTPISAIHGIGTGDLLDEVVARLPEAPPEEDLGGVGVAIVGRPNVGKSSLVNAILGRERSIVTDSPGTTRDVIDTAVEHRGQRLVLLDTAGIRRRGRVERGIEKYSVMRALRAVDRADVALVVIDAAEGITAQDTHLVGYIRDAHKGIGLLVNKWDLVTPRTSQTAEEFTARIRAEFAFVPYAPILYTSARTGPGVGQILDLVQAAVAAHQPASRQGRRLKIYYATQADVNPPTFVFFVNDPKLIHPSYERYLENRLRQSLDFAGTPLRLLFRAHVEGKRPA